MIASISVAAFLIAASSKSPAAAGCSLAPLGALGCSVFSMAGLPASALLRSANAPSVRTRWRVRRWTMRMEGSRGGGRTICRLVNNA